MINMKEGKSQLRPRARIIKTLGEELISNDIVAIIELVKNSFDADSTEVEIIFNEPLKEGKGSIIIKDNGTGMNIETIKEGWMEPATIIKKNKRKTNKGRNILGEKGIGRFASAKLSKQLEMVTLKKNDKEISVLFQWDEFEQDDRYLDEIYCKWRISDPKIIKNQGTILTLKYLNSDWDVNKITDLKKALSRLINPVAPIEDFKINLILPKNLEKLSGQITAPASLGKPDYLIKGEVLKNGYSELIYISKESGKELISKKFFDKKFIVGQFSFEFRVWNREPESLKNLASEIGSTLRDVKRDLNEVSGVSIYRDNFRVLPYGESENDWLRLDIRRVNNPTLRLSNNQILGYISLTSKDNPEFKDQSNREGLIESPEFDQLKEIIEEIFNEIEKRKYKEKRKENKIIERKGIFSDITIKPIKDIISKKLPYDLETHKIINETEDIIKTTINSAKEVLARYRRLSTLGKMVDRILHDGNMLLVQIDNNVKLLNKEFNKKVVNEEKIKSYIQKIKTQKEIFSGLFKELEPFSGRKRKMIKTIFLEEAIKDIFSFYEKEIQDSNLIVLLPKSKTEFKINESDFKIILINLIDNSLYWLNKKSSKKGKIHVQLEKTDNTINITFSDNGTGVNPNDIPYIFDPYYSTKPDGIGMGLTIVGELVSEYDGTIELVNGPLEGANFRIRFFV